MSDAAEPQPDDMQFDHAEYEGESAPVPECGVCHRSIENEYYECNGVLLCEPCRQAVGHALVGGSRVSRFLLATVYGLGAAVAGFAIYFGILKATGYQIGLISVLVGVMVGVAVRKGSNNRGGWAYQLLAMFLVYSAIVASYSAVFIPKMFADAKKANAAKEAAAGKPGAAAAPGGAAPANKPNPFQNMGMGQALGQLAFALLLLLGILYALPVLVGIHSPVGLLIVGFALWEAWKINRKTTIVFNGPYLVSDGGEDVAPDGAPGYA